MTDFDDLEGFGDSIEALQGALGGAGDLTRHLSAELARAQEEIKGATREVGKLSGGVSRGIKRAVDGLVLGGASLSDALDGIAKSVLDSAYSVAMRPVTEGLGDLVTGGINTLFGGLFRFADGAPLAGGRVVPFAGGGVVGGPTLFPMRGGPGLMGEAGPEAIMPLARGADGRLGVRGEGGGRPVNVVINISTPDVEGFRRSQSQIAARMSRALGQGARNR